MSFEKLSLSGLINEIKDVSSGPHPRRFCFVLGAGASIESGIKSGQQLVNLWDEELRERNAGEHEKWKKKCGITDTNKGQFYSHYYERRFHRVPKDGYNFLEKIMETAHPSIGYVLLAHILTTTNNNVVITTNFDHLVEDAISYYTHAIPLIIGHESLAHYITNEINRPTIIKIHRDLLFDPKSTTKQLEELADNWKNVLDTVFSKYHPVFIGYAGNDKSLMAFLMENCGKFINGEWAFPYWMLYENDYLGDNIKDLLKKTNGYLVLHNGFDDVMYRLGAAFDYKLPDKDEFLSYANNRYKELEDYFNEFTDKNTNGVNNANHSNYSSDDMKDADILDAIKKITRQTESLQLYMNAVMEHNASRYEEALNYERILVNKVPNNARYRHLLSVTLYKMKRYDKALAEIKKAIELEPNNAEYHNCLGITLHEMKLYDEALLETQKAIELEPNNAMYHDSLGVTLHEMKLYDEALEAKQKAIKLEPNNARCYDSLGVTLHNMKLYNEALAETKKAIELEPNNAWYHNSLGVTLNRMKLYDKALEEKRKAIELEPDNAEYHDSLGVTLYKMGRRDDALIEMQQAVNLEPTSKKYLRHLNAVSIKQKQ